LKIFGIDDTEDINLIMKLIAESHGGHDYTYTKNPHDGLKQIRESQFDLVFLDLGMPELSGKTIVDLLWKENILKKQKIVLLTAAVVPTSEIVEMIEKGVYDFINKPMDIDHIIKLIDKVEKSLTIKD